MNLLLEALAPSDQVEIGAKLAPMRLERGTTLFPMGSRLERVYFIDEGMVSLMSEFSDGTTAEITAVGPEGFVNVGSLLDDDLAIARYVVQTEGASRFLAADDLNALVRARPAIRGLLHRYIQGFINELAQSAACNLLHRLEERLARWLLLVDERNGGRPIRMTHDQLASMLAVRRASISEQAGRLSSQGLISHGRGRIEIIDRAGLRGRACECHSIIQRHYRRLMPEVAIPPD